MKRLPPSSISILLFFLAASIGLFIGGQSAQTNFKKQCIQIGYDAARELMTEYHGSQFYHPNTPQ